MNASHCLRNVWPIDDELKYCWHGGNFELQTTTCVVSKSDACMHACMHTPLNFEIVFFICLCVVSNEVIDASNYLHKSVS